MKGGGGDRGGGLEGEDEGAGREGGGMGNGDGLIKNNEVAGAVVNLRGGERVGEESHPGDE